MKQLRKLDLHGNPLDGSPSANLKDLSLLEELDLSKTQVDDESMAALAGLKNLKRLDLTGRRSVRGPGAEAAYGLKTAFRPRDPRWRGLGRHRWLDPDHGRWEINSGKLTDNGLYSPHALSHAGGTGPQLVELLTHLGQTGEH